jgi:hypothetical protein
MPAPKTRSPRLQVTLSEEVMTVLREMSEATGQGMGTIVSELMVEALPAMQLALQAIGVIKESPREAQRMLARFSNEATMKLAQEQLSFDDLISTSPAPKRQKRRKPPDGAT